MKRKTKKAQKKRTREILENFRRFKTLLLKIKCPPISYQRVLLMKLCNSNEVLWDSNHNRTFKRETELPAAKPY